MILELFSLVEQKILYSEITTRMNEKFGTEFAGVQRPGGKGFRGDVTRKVYRTAKVTWNDSEADITLIDKAAKAYQLNKGRGIHD